MASEEGWVGIADVAAHLSVAKDSIYRWVDTKEFPRTGWDDSCAFGFQKWTNG